MTLPDWSTLPTPRDDGAADHLSGRVLPPVALPATGGDRVRLDRLLGRTILYLYPFTGMPGRALPEGWDDIPGARGCTPQTCAFRDHFADLRAAGARHVHGVSTQSAAAQAEVVARLALPYRLLSDEGLALAHALGLPTLQVEGRVMLKRMAIVVDDAVITAVFYPVFPPDRNAGDVLAWLRANPA